MHTRITRNTLWLPLIASIFFGLDRYIKFIIPNVQLSQRDYFIGLDYFQNYGVAFSIPLPLWITIVCTPIIFLLLLWHIQKHPTVLNWVGFSFVFFGALSNFIDRIYFGFVIDYIRIGTAIINIADLMIIAGVLCFLFSKK